MIRLTVLVDNHAVRPGLAVRHGSSFLIELPDFALLFDAGQDDALLANAAALGVDLARAGTLVLSHGHWDHGDGLRALHASGWRGRLMAVVGCWAERRAVADGEPDRNVGLACPPAALAEAGIDCTTLTGPRALAPGVWTTGPIGGEGWAPATPRLQVRTPRGWQADPFADEQALVMQSAAGLVVLTGCCHRGVGNTLAAARAVSGERRIAALIGGLHLKDEPPERCRALARELEGEGVARLWVNHCTGVYPYRHLRQVLGDRVAWAGAGLTLVFH